MVFSSLTFLYAFLPVTFLLYFAVKNRIWRNCVLLAASLVLYSWGEPKYLFWMLGTVLVAYVCGLLIWRFERKEIAKKTALAAACVFLTASRWITAARASGFSGQTRGHWPRWRMASATGDFMATTTVRLS